MLALYGVSLDETENKLQTRTSASGLGGKEITIASC